MDVYNHSLVTALLLLTGSGLGERSRQPTRHARSLPRVEDQRTQQLVVVVNVIALDARV